MNPKFNVVDADGVKWGGKFGDEAKTETAATRLVWAVGYFTNEDYYLADLDVGQLWQKMKRGQNLIRDEKLEGSSAAMPVSGRSPTGHGTKIHSWEPGNSTG